MTSNNSLIKLPMGHDNFREIIDNKLDFVDKSLFIQEVIDDVITKVAVITRPRRFGKTLNMSMLQHFLASEVDGRSTKGLFTGLQIAQLEGGEYLKKHQGQYPVIFVSFKDVKNSNFEDALESFSIIIQKLFGEFNYLLHSNEILASEKETFLAILQKKADKIELARSLNLLSALLYKHHSKKIYLLIDEYDTPIQAAYSEGYYKEMVDFIRNLFGTALKGNQYLEKAIVTGILRISKESLFSDLNNVKVYSMLHPKYGQYFGFTETEVTNLLQQTHLEDKAEEVKNWYNGYKIGETIIYNPWSIANFINDRRFAPYWLNSSGNQLIKDLIVRSKDRFKSEIEDLLSGKPITCTIDEDMVFGDLEIDKDTAVWSLLLFSGYLKILEQNPANIRGLRITADIPNNEVRSLYHQIINRWLAGGSGEDFYNTLLASLLSGDIERFKEHFKVFINETTSYHDTAYDPEAFYHGLLIGLTASLYGNTNYHITSNRESGFGRFDYLIFSQDLTKPTIIFELKRVERINDKTHKELTDKKLDKLLDKTAHAAIKQIITKDYMTEAKRLGATNIIRIGIAFCGKRFAMKTIIANANT